MSKKFSSLISCMKQACVTFEPGLSTKERSEAERVFGFMFPEALRAFLGEGVPVSVGFYDWRDLSVENRVRIKGALRKPFIEIKEEINRLDWPSAWGTEPMSQVERRTIALRRLQRAPALIPLYAHRYMPAGVAADPPVFSIAGLDVICYGKDLCDYLEREFGQSLPPEFEVDALMSVPFWGDLL